jgi:hypothetical protein
VSQNLYYETITPTHTHLDHVQEWRLLVVLRVEEVVVRDVPPLQLILENLRRCSM